jgi:hypothetical protein
MKVYSAYSTSGRIFGSPKWPSKMVPTARPFLYSQIEVNLSLGESESSLVHHKRIYEIQNLSEEPLSAVFHQIATDVDKGFDELNLKVYDDDGKDLAITSITVDKLDQKEFYTAFVRPLSKGDKKRYILEYDVEEPNRYFENAFLTDCETFVVNIEYPAKKGIKRPRVYEVDMETEKQTKHPVQPKVAEITEDRNISSWSQHRIFKGQSFRFEW